MGESHFDSAMASLRKPQESRRLLKILVVLRKEMEWPKDRLNMVKFYDNGCMKQLIACMQRDNGSVLDVCLSILGNCAMERYISRNLVSEAAWRSVCGENYLEWMSVAVKMLPARFEVGYSRKQER